MNFTTTSRTGYIGMERDSELGLAEHGVRKYDEAIGRFTAPDALWEQYVGWSPYQYSLNNPVMFQDGNGYEVVFENENSEKLFNDLYEASDKGTRAKYDKLKESDIIYQIYVGENLKKIDPNLLGLTRYDFKNKRIVVSVGKKSNNPAGTLGEELEHAHQFETGRIGYVDGGATLGYDIYDEIDSKIANISATDSYNNFMGTNYSLSSGALYYKNNGTLNKENYKFDPNNGENESLPGNSKYTNTILMNAYINKDIKKFIYRDTNGNTYTP